MAINPWELRQDDSRQEDSIATYIIFCEDTNSEPQYFKSFEIEGRLKINTIPNQKQSRLNYINTIQYCVDNGQMEYIEGRYRIIDSVPEIVWCVYDRDIENVDFDKINNADNINFTTSIKNAEDAGIKVAWSNDVFELWLLLHFEEVSAKTKLHRKDIFVTLINKIKVFKNLRPETRHAMESSKFNYEYFKRRANFSLDILPELKDKTAIAIENSKNLAQMFTDNIPFHDRNPCTMVYTLVQELISFKEKA